MKLESLLRGIPGIRVRGNPATEISGLTCDSRKAAPGDLFFALPGERADGREFIGEAVKRGAHAVALSGAEEVPASAGVPAVEASDIRKSMAQIAARFFGEPSRALVLIGVTGTNGKTSFTYLMESILREAGLEPGVIGTVSYRYGRHVHLPANTTPESLDLQRILRDMVNSGVTHALMEVSSHGLDAHRVEACHFSRAAFTMLGRDHLDHHGDMEAYFASKARLFTELLPRSAIADRKAVVNQDDPHGQRLLDMIRVPAVTVGRRQEADYRLESAVCDREGISLRIRHGRKVFRLRSPLLAEVNAMNILLAVTVADGLDIAEGAIARGVERAGRIPGRLDRIATDRGFLVLVDYAHTPDALDRMLAGVRGFTPGRLITVFGCGGDRDRGKRPLMGKAAARWSDLVLVTSDNPRSEPPEAIIEEILAGMREEGIRFLEPAEIAGKRAGARAASRVVDRREAIGWAVRIAQEGDTVVIAGKGHEEVQIVGQQKIPFRDGEEVVRALRGIGNRESAIG